MKKKNLIFVCILAIVILFFAGMWFDSVFGAEKMECQKFKVTYEIQYNEITLADAAVKEEGFRLNYGDECEIDISVESPGNGYILWTGGTTTTTTGTITPTTVNTKSKAQKFKVIYKLKYENITLATASCKERRLRETYTDVCGIKVNVNSPGILSGVISPDWTWQNHSRLLKYVKADSDSLVIKGANE